MKHGILITYEDVKKRGYDLKVEGRLNKGDFTTIEEAIDDFLQDCFDTIYELIESYRGTKWTKEFFEDMSQVFEEETNPRAYELQQELKFAILQQTIFIYENGDSMARAEKEDKVSAYSEKAVRKLWNMNILRI